MVVKGETQSTMGMYSKLKNRKSWQLCFFTILKLEELMRTGRKSVIVIGSHFVQNKG